MRHYAHSDRADFVASPVVSAKTLLKPEAEIDSLSNENKKLRTRSQNDQLYIQRSGEGLGSLLSTAPTANFECAHVWRHWLTPSTAPTAIFVCSSGEGLGSCALVLVLAFSWGPAPDQVHIRIPFTFYDTASVRAAVSPGSHGQSPLPAQLRHCPDKTRLCCVAGPRYVGSDAGTFACAA
eukprot:448325-Pelagomonas_calceolata.AAC.2